MADLLGEGGREGEKDFKSPGLDREEAGLIFGTLYGLAGTASVGPSGLLNTALLSVCYLALTVDCYQQWKYPN